MPGQLRFGTCSWKYPSWRGLVYSAAKGIDYLAEYARRYDAVEVDQWFWSLFRGSKPGDPVVLPRPADVAAYRAAVGDDFRFTVKAPNSLTLTHFYAPKKGAPPVPNDAYLSPQVHAEFLDLLEPLRDLLGVVMFQFEYLNKRQVPSQAAWQARLGDFFAAIDRAVPYAVEVRNPRYLNPGYWRFLEAQDVSPVLVQGYWMPPVDQVYEQWRESIARHPVVVVRLMGPNRGAIEKATGKRWDRVVAPKGDDLPAIAQAVSDLLARGVSVYVNVNNHYEGSAPLTIDRLRAALGLGDPPALAGPPASDTPPTSGPAPEQGTLFDD